MNTTSESLLAKLGNRDDFDAWSRFVSMYTPLIVYWARQVGMNFQDACDLAQDVLGIVSQKIGQFNYDRERSFRGWLRAITLNRFRLLWRRRNRLDVQSAGSWVGELPDRHSLESTWDQSYRMELIKRAIATMRPDFAPKTWEALLELLRGESTAESIAHQHEVSVWTLYSAKSRLIKRIREELDGLLD